MLEIKAKFGFFMQFLTLLLEKEFLRKLKNGRKNGHPI